MKVPAANSSSALKAESSTLARRGGLVVGGERAEEVVAFESAVVDFFVTAADQLGVPKSVAAIYGIVFASPAALSFAEIESRLAISKGSISQGLRVLRDIGAVRAVGGAPVEGKSLSLSAGTAAGGADHVDESTGADSRGAAIDRRSRSTSSSPARRSDPSPIALSPSPAHRASPSPIAFSPSPARSAALSPSPARGASPSPIASSPSPARNAVRYVPDTEMRQLIARFLESRVQPQLAAGKGRLADLRERTTAFAPAHRAILRQRVAKLESWHARARGLLPLVRTFLKLGG